MTEHEAQGTLIPFVIEKSKGVERSYDIYSRLLKERIVFIGQPITEELANVVIAQLLFLQFQNKNQDIEIYINSPGGSVSAGLAIYDTMRYIRCDIATYCLGQAASMAALLLAAGTKGKRFALPNSRMMIHQPWGGARGTAADIVIQATEIGRLKQVIYRILAEHTGQPLERIAKDADRDFYMSAEESREYGLVDEVIAHMDK